MTSPAVLSFNMRHPIVGDKNFRLACAHGVDKEEVSLFMHGRFGVWEPSGNCYGFGTDFFNTNIPWLERDLDLAKKYLADSPYNGEELEIVGSEVNTRALEAVQQQLSEVGIKIRIKQLDSVALRAYSNPADNNTELLIITAAMNVSAHSYQNLVYRQAANNTAMYNNPVINEMLERAPTISDVNERRELYLKAQEIVFEDLPYLTIYYSAVMVALSKGIGGIGISNDNNHDLRYVYLDLDA